MVRLSADEVVEIKEVVELYILVLFDTAVIKTYRDVRKNFASDQLLK